MNHKKIIHGLLCALLAGSAITSHAQDGTEATFRQWALTPPMGWNSWDCYFSSVNEDITMKNARWQAEHLLEYGWEYVVVDIRWYANHPSNGGGWYNGTNPDCVLDAYGRYLPSPTRFPSAMQNGKNEGFKAMADEVHKMGMKFGIHIMRGLPKYILNNPSAYKLKGAENIGWNQVYSSTVPACVWLNDNLTVQNNRYGQLYYNSLADLYAEWGVDFIKVDDMSRPYAEEEINMLRRAIDQCGRPIVLSLSPGKTDINKRNHVITHANQWRMMDDLWDNWQHVKAVFAEANAWQPYYRPGNYADCDMLPLGKIAMTVGDPGYCNQDNGRTTNLTINEQYTMMTLWGICHSPLFFGGDYTYNDEFTTSLLTNRSYLDMHAYGMDAHQTLNRSGRISWTSVDPKTGDRFLALFFTDAGNGWIYDSKALYESETCAYTTTGHAVNVDIQLPEGTDTIALVVDDSGDNWNYDHGDWINPTFISRNGYEVPLTGEFVLDKYTKSYFNRINENQNVLGNGKMSVLGTTYDRGFASDANSLLICSVPDSIVGFKAMAALDDSGIGQQGSTTTIKFYVFDCDPRTTAGSAPTKANFTVDLSSFGYDADQEVEVIDVWNNSDNSWLYANEALYESNVLTKSTHGHQTEVDINLSDNNTGLLALVVDDGGDNWNYDHGDWINPTYISKNGYEVPVTGDFIKEKYTKSWFNRINENKNVEGNGKMKVEGTTFDRGFASDANSLLLLNVPDSIVGFKAIAALDDSGVGQTGSTTSIRFYVFNIDPRITTRTTDRSMGMKKGSFITSVSQHGAKLYRLKPQRSESSTLTLNASSISNTEYAITADITPQADEQSYVKFEVDGKFVGSIKVAPGTRSVVYHAKGVTEGEHSVKAYFSGTTQAVSAEAETTFGLPTAIQDAATEKFQVNVTDSTIQVKGAKTPVRIYNSLGALVHEGSGVASLPHGIYIVQAGKASCKAVVK